MSGVRNASVTGVLHGLDVLVKRALLRLERRGRPGLSAPLEFLRRDSQLDRVVHGIDGNDISIVDQRDGPADLGLRHNVANDEPMGARCVA